MVFSILLLTHDVLFASNFIFNNPYFSDESQQKIYYTSYDEQPKTLDPARSYSTNEHQFNAQIYEPVLQYDYLTRPYKLIPLTATQMPQVRYYDKANHQILDPQMGQVARSVYVIQIKPGILYQPHPAFAQDKLGRDRYFPLPQGFLENYKINNLRDFKGTGTRELIVDDYIYQIKRLANPATNSPVYGLMSQYILGFEEYAKTLPAPKTSGGFLDLRKYSLSGLHKVDDHKFELSLQGHYPQFIFWLAMTFFAPVPWEVDRFYAQTGMENKNLGLGWYPIGTGPFMMAENNPNNRMVLEKNPNYRETFFPTTGSQEDKKKGYLHHPGQRLPLIDKAIYILEKESIPRWNKFLQGYYDLSAIGEDSFDQTIQINHSGEATLTPVMRTKGLKLSQAFDSSIFYLGFNMLDPLVGGTSERARKLRQAISIAVNYDEYIAIFFNGRGLAAQGPIPPGIFGYREGGENINPYVYTWDGRQPVRRSIADADALMVAAGYPNGRDPATGEALILNYDVSATAGPDDKAQLDWMIKQFARIGIALNVNATQYNRFQEKVRNGNAQIFNWGWSADYPDPENFLFLLYGANGKVKHGGENATNYHNPVYDKLFESMKNRANDRIRQQLIDKMLALIRHDAPWVWGISSESFVLSQQWVAPIKPNTISISVLKYVAIDVLLRNKLRHLWNKPVLWPLLFFILLLAFVLLILVNAYRKQQQRCAPRVQL